MFSFFALGFKLFCLTACCQYLITHECIVVAMPTDNGHTVCLVRYLYDHVVQDFVDLLALIVLFCVVCCHCKQVLTIIL